MSLSEEERQRIEEEERFRAETRVRAEAEVRQRLEEEAAERLLAQSRADAVKKKKEQRSGCLGCLGVILVLSFLASLGSRVDEARDSGSKSSTATRPAASASNPTPPPRELTAEEKAKAAEEAANEEKRRRANERLLVGTTWRYSSYEDDLGRGQVKTAQVLSTNQVNFDFPYQGLQRGRLALRIHPKHGKDVILAVEKGQFNCGIDDCFVTVRFGSGKPVRYSVNEAADHSTTIVFLQNYTGFVANLRKVDKVWIEAPFYQEGEQVFEFEVDGLNWP